MALNLQKLQIQRCNKSNSPSPPKQLSKDMEGVSNHRDTKKEQKLMWISFGEQGGIFILKLQVLPTITTDFLLYGDYNLTFEQNKVTF